MDWFAIWKSIKLVRYLIRFDKWIDGIIYVFNYYCRSPYRVAVFGTSGAGKTEIIRALVEEPVGERDPERTGFYQKKVMQLKNGRKILLIDAPGHSTLVTERNAVTEMIVGKKIKGIINVVTYGYNEAIETEDVTIFKVPSTSSSVTREVKDEYLNTNRKNELNQINEWSKFITGKSKIEWVITIVNKADIWYNKKEKVLDYYNNGEYYTGFTSSISQVCTTNVFPYCSLIAPFGKKTMLLDFSEREKTKMHNDLKKNLLSLVSHVHEC